MRRGTSLSGVTVLDLSRIIAGPLATQILSDLGADVIKVERIPNGDESRAYGDVRVPEANVSALFLSMNRNKRSLGLNALTDEGREVLQRLAEQVDVVVHNFRPGVMDRLGLGYARLSAANPKLIYCGISAFGDVGAMRDAPGNDLIAQAYSGLMSFIGNPGEEAVRCPVSIADLTAGMYAAIGILGALHRRQQLGVGCAVDTSLLESMLSLMGTQVTDFLQTGYVAEKMGSANRLGQPNQAFRTADGWIVISAVNDTMWQRCCEGLGLPELAYDERFVTLAQRYRNRPELIAEISRRTSELTSAEAIRRLRAVSVTCSEIRTIADIADDGQVQAIGAVEVVECGNTGVPVVGTPLHMSDMEDRQVFVPALAGQDTWAVLTAYGYSAAEVETLLASGVAHTSHRGDASDDTDASISDAEQRHADV
jgi:crotonobetainyl-CoA:carnitine CoA-transferase CaiB-like acyl-CoA transferase